MDAKIERRISGGDLRDFEEPGAGYHHRRRNCRRQSLAQLEEGGVGAVAHADIVLVQHQPAFGFGHAHQPAWSITDAGARQRVVQSLSLKHMEPTV